MRKFNTDDETNSLPATALARILEASGNALVALDPAWHFVYINPIAASFFRQTATELIGQTITYIYPEIVTTVFWEIFNRAVRDQAFLTIEDYFAPWSKWIDVHVLPQDGLLYLHFRDTTPTHVARQTERKTQQRVTAILESMDEGFVSVDKDWIITYVNGVAERISGKHPHDIVGRNHWDVWPMLIGTQAEVNYQKAIEQNTAVHYERYSEAANAWLEVHAYPISQAEGGGINIFFRDVTVRKQAEERAQFLSALSERSKVLLDPDAVVWETIRSTGEFLKVARCAFFEVNDEAETMAVRLDWTRAENFSFVGTIPISLFGNKIIETLRSGQALVVTDVRKDERLTQKDRDAFLARGIHSFLNVPVVKEGRWVNTFIVNHTSPRDWTKDEEELLTTLAERTWLAVENARLYHLTRESEARFRALAEASTQMIWRSDASGRTTEMPEWLIYTGMTQEETYGTGWLKAVHPDDRTAIFEARQAARQAQSPYELEYRLLGKNGIYRWFVVRGVPIFDENGIVKEYIGTWTDIDARKQEAERNIRIAETLQRSMLLAPPENAFPGISIKPLYQSAQDDLLIGGDFFDIFAVAQNQIALVIGDATGKGLEAATYTAEIKFALRAFLQEFQQPRIALERLNAFIASKKRLQSARRDYIYESIYAALAICVIDTATGDISCTCAGIEPPFVIRVDSNTMETLSEGCGPLLGAFEDSEYGEHKVILSPNDILVMFTDGLTEARKPESYDFFGSDRLVLAVQERTKSPVSLADLGMEIAEQVRLFAGGSINDDVCLLLARRQ